MSKYLLSTQNNERREIQLIPQLKIVSFKNDVNAFPFHAFPFFPLFLQVIPVLIQVLDETFILGSKKFILYFQEESRKTDGQPMYPILNGNLVDRMIELVLKC